MYSLYIMYIYIIYRLELHVLFAYVAVGATADVWRCSSTAATSCWRVEAWSPRTSTFCATLTAGSGSCREPQA